MENLTIKSAHKSSIWSQASYVIVSQWKLLVGAMLIVLPVQLLLSYGYTTYSPWLFWRESYHNLALKNYYGLISFWFIVPFLFGFLYNMTILALREQISSKHYTFLSLVKEAVYATCWMAVSGIAIFCACWFFWYMLLEVKSLLPDSSATLATIAEWLLMTAFLFGVLSVIRERSFSLQIYLLRDGLFKEAIQESRQVVKSNNCKVRRHDCLFILILFMVPLFMVFSAYFLGESVENMWQYSRTLSILILIALNGLFLFVSMVRSFLFFEVEKECNEGCNVAV
jgi:hypothetical protein